MVTGLEDGRVALLFQVVWSKLNDGAMVLLAGG